MPLGKGLNALISDEAVQSLGQAYIPDLDINRIVPNPYQPRIHVDDKALQELSDSIKEHGVIEPLIVTKKDDSKYELIAGERRWRAAKLGGMKKIPVVVKEASPQQMLELAVVENVQRQDLNPLEEALAYEQLVKMFKLSHGDVAQKVGLSRPAVANKIRLLGLPEEVKRLLLENKLSEGHARALLGLNSEDAMLAAAKIIIKDNLNVRAVEELVRRLNYGHKETKQRNMRIIDEYTQNLETSLKGKFGKNTKLFRSQRGGKIVIPFKTDKELEQIYKHLI